MALADHIAALAALATTAATREELRRETLRRIHPIVGFDFGIVWRPGERDATLDGFDELHWRAYCAGAPRYAEDLSALATAALAQGGVTRDAVALSVKRRDASPFYAEIVRPVGSASFLTAVLSLRGETVAVMQLGRGGPVGLSFRERDAQRLRPLLGVLALGEAAQRAPGRAAPIPSEGLTPREAEIVRYVQLGFTNKEIALACGTSRHTVRNQLAAIFRKAKVTTRAELVARAFGATE
jgi:DNA-binding CsgD family transcriptional regulator